MTASERLRELAAETPRGAALLEAYYEDVSPLLPLIADVVREAEVLYAEAATAAPLWDRIDAALTTLKEALDAS